MKNKEEIREDFCPACIAVPLAMAGAGTSKSASTKQTFLAKVIFWLSIIITVISIIVAIWYFTRCEECAMKLKG
tara:strand:- start:238 stop:459 length:222 start_codon:yes stop_codon:yes gene_type:complete